MAKVQRYPILHKRIRIRIYPYQEPYDPTAYIILPGILDAAVSARRAGKSLAEAMRKFSKALPQPGEILQDKDGKPLGIVQSVDPSNGQVSLLRTSQVKASEGTHDVGGLLDTAWPPMINPPAVQPKNYPGMDSTFRKRGKDRR